MLRSGGRALTGLGGLPAYRTPSNSEYRAALSSSQTVGDKLHRQKGNSPDHQLRSPIDAQWERKSGRSDNQEVGLEAAILERVRNSSLVE